MVGVQRRTGMASEAKGETQPGLESYPHNCEFCDHCECSCADPGSQVGLLSAVITSFMVYVQPKLEQDHTQEAAALLRILVYNANHNAFGGEVPQIPEWKGASKILSASEYLLYLAFFFTIGSGSSALIIRVFSELNIRMFLGSSIRSSWIFYTFLFFLWTTMIYLCCAFSLLFIAATLQFADAVSSSR